MPDPLSLLGGVAASVQLVEIAAKLSHEIYSFFHAVNGAGADAHRQLTIVDEVKAALDLVSTYITRYPTNHSTAVDDGLLKLEAVLKNLCNDMKSVRALIPSGPRMGVSVKTMWILRRKEFDCRLKSLEGRKTTFDRDFGIPFHVSSPWWPSYHETHRTKQYMTLRQDQKAVLRSVQDLETAMKNLDAQAVNASITNTATRDSVLSLGTEASVAQMKQEQVLLGISDAIPREGDRTRAALNTHSDGLRRVGDMLSDHESTVGGWMSAQTQLLEDLSTALPRETSRIDSRLDELIKITSLTNSRPYTTSTTYEVARKAEHLVARIAREEIRRAMHPILEKVSESQTRCEPVTETLTNVIEDVASRLWDDSSFGQGLESEHSDITPEGPVKEYLTREPNAYNTVSSPNSDLEKELAPLSCSHTCQPLPILPEPHRRRRRRQWTYWARFSWLGTIRIEVREGKTWDKIKSRWSTDLSVSVTFWPSWPLLRRQCISLLYTTEPSHSGYHQIFPMIATFPVIPNNAPVWNIVGTGDIEGLRYAFQNGLASPNDQGDSGFTLLHLEMCKFLLEMGALVDQSTTYGDDTMRIFLLRAWMCLTLEEHGSFASVKSLIQIFYALIQGGSDTEDRDLDFSAFIAISDINEDSHALGELTEWSALLRRHNPQIMNPHRFVPLLFSGKATVDLILACGLDPNLAENGSWRPIFVVLHRVGWNLEKEEDGNVERVARLITAGADVYTAVLKEDMVREADPELYSKGRELLHYAWNYWREDASIVTPTTFAVELGIEHYWKQALRKAGFDPAEVYAEDARRRREWHRSHGAARVQLKSRKLGRRSRYFD